MKKLLFIIALFCFVFSGKTYGQRCLPGMKGVQVTGGFTDGIYFASSDDDAGFYFGTAISKYTKRANKWVFGAEYLQKDITHGAYTIPLAQFTGEGGFNYRLMSDRNRVFLLYTGLSALGGYEAVNWGEKMLSDGSVIRNKEAFIYGGAINLELETYLSDKVVLLISGRQRVLWGTTTGHFHTQFGLGVKYIIN
jgi:Conjugative transposon protein TraO.